MPLGEGEPGPEVVVPVWEGTLKVGPVELRCYVTAEGVRFFNAEDVERLFTTDDELTVEDFQSMATWMKGQE